MNERGDDQESFANWKAPEGSQEAATAETPQELEARQDEDTLNEALANNNEAAFAERLKNMFDRDQSRVMKRAMDYAIQNADKFPSAAGELLESLINSGIIEDAIPLATAVADHNPELVRQFCADWLRPVRSLKDMEKVKSLLMKVEYFKHNPE